MDDTADGLGTILTGGIAAREIDRDGHGGATQGGHGHEGAGGACLNCGAIRSGGFCQDCGQGGHVHRTVAAIGHDIAHGVFHFDGKFWVTLPMLVRRPGELTRRYVHGERMRFVSPMALFLFSVFLLFAAVNRVSMPDVAGMSQGLAKAQSQIGDEADKARDALAALIEKRADRLADDPKADVAALDKQIAEARSSVAALTNVAAHLPRSAVPKGKTATMNIADIPIDTGSAGLDRQLHHVQDNPQLYAYKLKMASYKFSWALIPISVPFIWLLFCRRRDVGLYDHAIFAIYSLSFMTLLVVGLIGLALIGVPEGPLWLTLLIAPPLHMYRQLKGAYLLRRFGAAWRTAALLLSTTITGSLFFALLLWMEAE